MGIVARCRARYIIRSNHVIFCKLRNAGKDFHILTAKSVSFKRHVKCTAAGKTVRHGRNPRFLAYRNKPALVLAVLNGIMILHSMKLAKAVIFGN